MRSAYAYFPAWAPSGRSIAVLAGTKNARSQVAVVPAAGGTLRWLTSFAPGTGFDDGPVWAGCAGAILISVRPPG
jgi:hypothetical protein